MSEPQITDPGHIPNLPPTPPTYSHPAYTNPPLYTAVPPQPPIKKDISWGMLWLWGIFLSVVGVIIYYLYHGYKNHGVTFRDTVRALVVGLICWLIWTLVIFYVHQHDYV